MVAQKSGQSTNDEDPGFRRGLRFISVEAPGIEEQLLGDFQRNQRQSDTTTETGETEIRRVDLDHAAEFAARQTAPRADASLADDVEEAATALWEQARRSRRSSVEAVVFGFDGAL